jgi:hypothetical protein
VAAATIPVITPGPVHSRLPVAAAVAAGILAILVVLLVRRNSEED